jgi:hypothetical protein
VLLVRRTFIELGLPNPRTCMKDPASLIVATFALAVSLATFVMAQFRERATARDSRIKALQGEKEAVAYVAYKIRSHAWDRYLRSARFRDEAITALVLAFLMEGADRAKALVFAALVQLTQSGYWAEVGGVLRHLHGEMKRYQMAFAPSDFEKRVQSLEALAKALGTPLPEAACLNSGPPNMP